MSKERKSVTLDPEVAAYLDSNCRNASQTVNKLVKMEMGEDVVNEQLLKMRMEMEKDRYESAAQKAKGHLERYNQLEKQWAEHKSRQQKQLTQAYETLESVPWEEDNTAIQKWAEKVGKTPRELIKQLEEYHAE